MTWTYSGSPGTSSAPERRDAVRVLVGDTNTSDQQIDDEAISFNLAQAGDDIYRAASMTARQIAATYARRANTKLEGVSVDYKGLQDSYLRLAGRLEKDATLYGSRGLGTPIAGGISVSDMEAEREDSDRPEPAFERRQFRNPPSLGDDDEDEWR